MEWKEHYGTGTSRQRRGHGAEPGAWDQPEGVREVAQARDGCRSQIGPKEPRPTILSEAGEAVVVAFRRHTLLPLGDCLYALQPSIPRLTRSARHHCLQRHGISQLTDVEGRKPERQRFKLYPIGLFQVGIAEVQTAEGKLYLFTAIDRTSKFAIAQPVEKADSTPHGSSWNAYSKRSPTVSTRS